MWRSGPRQIFFFLKHPPTVHSLGSALGVGRVALHRTGGRSAAAFRPSLRSRRNAAVDRPPVLIRSDIAPPALHRGPILVKRDSRGSVVAEVQIRGRRAIWAESPEAGGGSGGSARRGRKWRLLIGQATGRLQRSRPAESTDGKFFLKTEGVSPRLRQLISKTEGFSPRIRHCEIFERIIWRDTHHLRTISQFSFF